MSHKIDGWLAVFKGRPARVVSSDGEKIELDTPSERLKVRRKDVVLLCEGLRTLADAAPLAGDPEPAWELLSGEVIDIKGLADLVYGRSDPAAVWSAWLLLQDGGYFSGTPDRIAPLPETDVQRIRAERGARADAAHRRADFAARLKARAGVSDADKPFLREIEAFAEGSTDSCKLMREAGLDETQESAHAALLAMKVWTPRRNPYPTRHKVARPPSTISFDAPSDDGRLDLTGLPAYAIDDEDSHDPDDAVSIDDRFLYVHVADPAAVVSPGSPLDLSAMDRASTLYLPEGISPMLPPSMVDVFGLGLSEISRCLTFRIPLDGASPPDVVLSLARVRRLSYRQADEMLETNPDFVRMSAFLDDFRLRRIEAGAAQIRLPESKIKVLPDGRIDVKPLPLLRARELVVDAMLAAGAAAADFAARNRIPMIHACQAPPDDPWSPESMSEMFSYRKKFRRTQYKINQEPHSGLGLKAYCQVTSPLRRYLDLVCHQQIRAFLSGVSAMGAQELISRIGSVELTLNHLRECERSSNKHWLVVRVMEDPEWSAEAVLLEARWGSGVVMIPSLGMEERIDWAGALELNESATVKAAAFDLPQLRVILNKI